MNETEFVMWTQALSTLMEAVVYVDDGTQFDSDGNIIQDGIDDDAGEVRVAANGKIPSEKTASTKVGTPKQEPQQQNSRWTGRVELAIKTRLRELRREEETKLKRLKMTTIARASAASTATTPRGKVGDETSLNRYIAQTMNRGFNNVNTTTNIPGAGTTILGGPGSGINSTVFVQQVTMIPMWVPSSFLPFLISSKRQSSSIISKDQVEAMQNDILFGSRFYVTSYDSVPIAVVFRGNVRTPKGLVNETDDRLQTAVVFEEIQQRLEKDDSDLSDKIQLFMMADPEWRPNRDEREPQPKPVILALSKSVTPDVEEDMSDSKTVLSKTKKAASQLLHDRKEAVFLQKVVKVSS